MNGGSQPRRWCVVGGGMLGLTLALRLAQAGHKVAVREAGPSFGGLAAPWRVGDVLWDRYYHVILLSDQRLRRLLDELDLDREIRWTVTQTGFFGDDRLIRLNDAIDYLRFPLLGFIDKMRLAATILYAASLTDGRRLERVPVETWLSRLSGATTYRRIWRPLLRAKLGDNHRHASAAFIWAVIRRLYAARRSGLKREMFGYVPGGYARVLERLEERLRGLGVDLRCGCPVRGVTRDGEGLCVAFDPGGEERFDEVVVTVPSPLAARLCPDLETEERCRLNGILYQGIVCASVLLKQPLAPYYLTYIADERIPFTAVVEMSALVGADQLGGRGLVYLPRYVTADDPFAALEDTAVEAAFLEGLRAIHPGLRCEDVLAVRVARAPHVLAVTTLDYSDRLPPMRMSVPGLSVVNTAHIVGGTLNVDETVALAERAAALLLNGRETQRSPAP